jgi:hypothetical protein
VKRAGDSRRRQTGSTLLELVLSSAIVGIGLFLLVQHSTAALSVQKRTADSDFAYRKAVAILAEIQSAVDQGIITETNDLDALADADSTPFLTVQDVPTPEALASGNELVERERAWKWHRRIEVDRVDGLERSRYVRVRIYHHLKGGGRRQAAVTAGLLNVRIESQPIVRDLDVYLLAIENVPSSWQTLPSLRALFESLRGDIEGANPGIALHFHWITKLGYGRDPLYTPYINATGNTSDAEAPYAYWYPSKLPATAGMSRLYDADAIGGRIRIEGGTRNGYDAITNPLPYALADRFNHCLRMPEARALFDARVAAGLEDPDEPPLQILLDDLERDPERFRGALIVNLHGGALPMPPVRNVADAAKDPATYPGVRAVTHPARIHTPAVKGGPPLDLLVHAYDVDPEAGRPAVLSAPILVQIFGGDFRAGLTVESLVGGVDTLTGLPGSGAYALLPAATTASDPFAMYYEVGFQSGAHPHTWLLLHNTPLVCPPVAGGGLPTAQRLYGADHVPSPVAGGLGGFYAMSVYGVDEPKNTMRWRLRIDQTTLGGTHASDPLVHVETRIGSDPTTGRAWPTPHQPWNVSRAYAWWSESLQDVPLLERYQILGDPRHYPYLDGCAQGDSFPHGYNWYFDDLRSGLADATASWTCLDATRLQDGTSSGAIANAPRALQIWRQALQAAGAVLVNPGGGVAESLLFGGEIGLPGPDGFEPAPLAGAFYGISGGNALDLQDIRQVPGTANGTSVVVGPAGFLAKPWLGELFPDSEAASYQTLGNLTTAQAWRQARTLVAPSTLPYGTDWNDPSGAWLGTSGGSMLLQGAPSNRFQQFPTNGTSTILPVLYDYMLDIGLSGGDVMAARRPFVVGPLAGLGPGVDSFAFSDSYPDWTLEALEQIESFSDPDARGVAVLRTTPVAGGRGVHVVPMAPTATSASEHHELAHRALGYALRAYEAGVRAQTAPLPPVPYIEILAPQPGEPVVGGSTVLEWDISFGAEVGAGADVDERGMGYVVTYRAVDDPTYRFVETNDVAPIDPRDAISNWLLDTAAGRESLAVELPPGLPPGDYFLRVDGFRRNTGQHATHHEVQVRVD